jgi:hypothetical protein
MPITRSDKVLVSGETLIAKISGEVVQVSGQVLVASISGETVLSKISGETLIAKISGETVKALTSGDVALISGQTVRISGETVIGKVSGEAVKISGEAVKISGETVKPDVLQFLDKTVITNPRFFYKTYEGYGFSISHRFENVSAGASVNIYFENPADSGREVFVVVIDVISFAQAWVDVYRGATASGGTSITPVNLNLGSAVSSVANVKHGVTYSGEVLVHSTVIPGGSKVQATGGAAEVGETVVIPEGLSILVVATNKSTSSTDLSIRIVWWEEAI